MSSIIAVRYQTVFDLALQVYGDISKFVAIIDDNPGIQNEGSVEGDEFDLAMPVSEGYEVFYDPEKIDKNKTREITGKVISYDENN